MPYPGELVLQFVPGIDCLGDAWVEGVVAAVERRPHLVGAEPEQRVDVSSELLTGSSLTLRPPDVLLGEPDPCLRYGDAESGW